MLNDDDTVTFSFTTTTISIHTPALFELNAQSQQVLLELIDSTSWLLIWSVHYGKCSRRTYVIKKLHLNFRSFIAVVFLMLITLTKTCYIF